jgi:hypothetical protein
MGHPKLQSLESGCHIRQNFGDWLKQVPRKLTSARDDNHNSCCEKKTYFSGFTAT